MQVARLEGDDVHLDALVHSVEVLRLEHGAFAKVGPEVVDEHASFYVTGGRGTSFQAQGFHVTMRIEMA